MSQAIGAAILVFLTVDVFLTVFHAQGHAGPITRMQTRAVWALVRTIGVRRNGPPRDTLLGLAAPIMVVLTLALWVLLPAIGFALIYLPHVQTFLFSPDSLRTPWWEALYYSGYPAATLGLGDMVPDRGLPLQLTPLLTLLGGNGSEPLQVDRHPSFLSMQDARRAYLTTVEDGFIPRRFRTDVHAGDPVERAHQRLLAYMTYDHVPDDASRSDANPQQDEPT